MPHKGYKQTLEHKLLLRDRKLSNPTKYWLGKKRVSMCGKNNPKWVKDRTKIKGRHERSFHDPEYKQWRKKVLERDNNTCRLLSSDCEGRLESHHIFSWKEFPELRYIINNGIALCHRHHPKGESDEKRMIPILQELLSVSKVLYRNI
jgi:hypothetical protein